MRVRGKQCGGYWGHVTRAIGANRRGAPGVYGLVCHAAGRAKPRTHAELAEQLGVSLDTLRQIQREPGFVVELGDAVLEALRDQLPNLTGRYIEAACATEGEKLRGLLEQMGALRSMQGDKPRIILGVDPDLL
jgi:hypothetical protein